MICSTAPTVEFVPLVYGGAQRQKSKTTNLAYTKIDLKQHVPLTEFTNTFWLKPISYDIALKMKMTHHREPCEDLVPHWFVPIWSASVVGGKLMGSYVAVSSGSRQKGAQALDMETHIEPE